MYFSHNTITPCLALLASSQSMMSLSKAPNSKNITLHNSTAGNFSDIWGSHSGDHEDGTSLGCNVMSPGRSMQAFQSNLLLLSCVLLFQKKKKTPDTVTKVFTLVMHEAVIPLQCQKTSDTLHGITSQETDICRKCHCVPPETTTTSIFFSCRLLCTLQS